MFTRVSVFVTVRFYVYHFQRIPMPCIVVTVANQKGGSGKTTLTGMLAGELLGMGFDVALVDLDPQRSLTEWLGSDPPGVLRDCLLAMGVPAGRAFPADRLRSCVELARSSGAADFLLIDTPPQLTSEAATAAMRLSDLVLIPVQPSALDVRASARAIALAAEAAGGSSRVALVPFRLRPRSVSSRELPALLSSGGCAVLPGISERQAVADATASGLTLAESAPRSPARQEFAALAAAVHKFAKTSKRSLRGQK